MLINGKWNSKRRPREYGLIFYCPSMSAVTYTCSQDKDNEPSLVMRALASLRLSRRDTRKLVVALAEYIAHFQTQVRMLLSTEQL